MKVTRREALQLAGVVAGATLFTTVLQMRRPLGTDVGGVRSAEEVRRDLSSPMEDNAAADLTIIVFTDYRCPACRLAHPAMKRAAHKDGKVRIVYKDWPIFGDVSERAAQVAIASDLQDIYPLVHDRLMTQRTHDDAALRSAIEQSGGDWSRLQDDLVRNRSDIATLLARNSRQAYALGLAGTPGYLIGPILVRGALDESEFVRVFAEAREKS